MKEMHASTFGLAASLVEECFSGKQEARPEEFLENFLKSKPWLLEPRALCQEVL